MNLNKGLLLIGILLSGSGLFAQSNGNNGTVSIFTNQSTQGSAGNPPPQAMSQPPVIMSKKGEMYLPQAGDWVLSMNATPWINYFGNLLHGPASSSSFLNSAQTIVGKYYVDDHTAYRLLLRIGINSTSQNQEIASSDTGNTFPIPQAEDKRSISNHFIGVGFGIEKRRGKTRLQGYYGMEAMFFLSGSDTTFTYGNSYNSITDPAPTYYDWSSGGIGTFGLNAPRTTENSPGATFGISILGYVGVEYFIAPKISIGGEYTWGIIFQTTGQGTVNREEINSNTGVDQTDTYKTGGSSTFSLDNSWNQVFGSGTGSLYINFHF